MDHVSSIISPLVWTNVYILAEPRPRKYKCGLSAPCPPKHLAFRLVSGAANVIGPKICLEDKMWESIHVLSHCCRCPPPFRSQFDFFFFCLFYSAPPCCHTQASAGELKASTLWVCLFPHFLRFCLCPFSVCGGFLSIQHHVEQRSVLMQGRECLLSVLQVLFFCVSQVSEQCEEQRRQRTKYSLGERYGEQLALSE